MSLVRERAALRDAPPTLRGRHVAIGESGGLGSVTGALRRRLTLAGTRVSELHHPDASVQAKEANELGVDVFVGLRLNPSTSSCRTAFWSGTHDESPGGRRLAELVQGDGPAALGVADGASTACRSPSCARPGCLPSWSRSARPAPWSSTPRPSPPPSRWHSATGPTPPGTDYP